MIAEPIDYGFHGRVAIVTGGGSGIGEAIARQLAHSGATVAIADIALTEAQRAAAAIQAGGGTAFAVDMDVTSGDTPAALAAVEQKYLMDYTEVVASIHRIRLHQTKCTDMLPLGLIGLGGHTLRKVAICEWSDRS